MKKLRYYKKKRKTKQRYFRTVVRKLQKKKEINV